MDCVRLGDIVVHYRHRPAAPSARTVVFINSLGTDFRIWDGVIEALDAELGVVVYDKRGHGLSGVGSAPYTIADHAGELARPLETPGMFEAIVSGLSVGGPLSR